MSQTEPKCPECRVEMEIGSTVDQSHVRLLVPKWVKGPPDWNGFQWWEGRSLKDHEVFRVVSYRCPNCGLLLSFARAHASQSELKGRA